MLYEVWQEWNSYVVCVVFDMELQFIGMTNSNFQHAFYYICICMSMSMYYVFNNIIQAIVLNKVW